MALTIAIEGLGNLDNADAVTNWGITGSGGSSISLDNEIYYQGSGSIASQISSGKNGWIWYNHGSALNFTTTYLGEYILLWWQCTTPGSASVINGAQQGITFRAGSSTSVYREWRLGGSDTFANDYTGGWQCAVIDPTSTGTNDVGAYNANSVQYWGIHYDGNTSSRGVNVFCDATMVGSGLRITGTETTTGAGWQEVIDYCTDIGTRAWGFVQNTAAGPVLYGTMNIGDSTQTAVTSFTDSGQSFVFGDYEYYSNIATPTLSSSISDGFNGFNIEDASGFTTTFQDGIAVGTDGGRAGSTFRGSEGADTTFDFYGGSNAASTTKLYNTSLVGIDGAVTWGNDADHLYYSGSLTQCAQFDPVGAVELRNLTISETVDVDAALVWNENIDIQKSSFIANTIGAAIEHPSAAGTPYDYYDLIFSGNTFDGLNSSGTDIDVNLNGTSDAADDEGANTITYLSSATLTMVVKDQGGTVVVGANAYIDDNNQTPFIMSTTTNASGIATVGHTAGAVTGATWRVRKYGYRHYIQTADIPASGTKEIPVTLITDPQQT